MSSPGARQRRTAFADQLAHAGHLTDPRWFDAFATVSREAFVSTFAVPLRDGGFHSHDLRAPADAEAALSAVYSDSPLLTQFDTGGTATSSSTAPSLMALMLHQLDVHPGHTVLEIGTGTGYNAALLTHVLGGDSVTSIDIHPGLVAAARAALDAEGYRPHLDVADGCHGYPDRAPYDRIIATCGLKRVPAAWLQQVRPGSRILVNLSFALLLLTVNDDGTATGRFGESAAFMAMRDDPTDIAATAADVLTSVADADKFPTRRAPWNPHLTAQPVAFLRALAMPTLQVVTRHTPEGSELLLREPATDSWARARRTAAGAELAEHGPQQLYDKLAELAIQWDQHGRPTPDRYGLTITADGHHTLWLDEPQNVITVR
jgi:protein-L-isoaspartate O-methyltransferase